MKPDNLPQNPDAPQSFATGVSAAIVSWTTSLLQFPARILPCIEALINLPLRLIQGVVVAMQSKRSRRAEQIAKLKDIDAIIKADPMMMNMPYVITEAAGMAVRIPLPEFVMDKYMLVSGDIVQKDQAKELLITAMAWSRSQRDAKSEKLTILMLGG